MTLIDCVTFRYVIDPARQIKGDPVFNSTVVETATVGADGKVREMVCLPLDMIHGWLLSIPLSRIKGEERRNKIIQYKKECYQALYTYWTKGSAVNPRIDEGQILELRRQLGEYSTRLQLAESEKKTLQLESKFKDVEISQLKQLDNIFGNRTPIGSTTKDGRVKDRTRRGCLTASQKALTKKASIDLLQLLLGLQD